MARPRKQVDEKLISKLASIACTTEEIAIIAGVSKDTLERRFAAVIEKGRHNAKASLRRMQWKTASKGNATMQIWLGKQHLGQTDKVENKNQHSGHITYETEWGSTATANNESPRSDS